MKTALVTGGSRGIGLAVAKQLQKLGYKTVIGYFSNETLARKAEKDLGVFSYGWDVSDPVATKKAVEEIVKVHGDISVLVNSAGISLPQKFVLDVTEEEFDRVFAVNVKGTFNVTKAVLPSMLKLGEGSIVNLSSIWGIDGGSCESVYSASKGAIISFTKSLAKELKEGNVRVNAVAPGLIETDMNARLTDDDKADFCSSLTVKRAGRVEEVADAVCFLIENEYMAGQILRIDGGME